MTNEIKHVDAMLDAAAKHAISLIDWGGGGGETVLVMMGYNPEEVSAEDRSSDEFQAQLMQFFTERCGDALSEIEWRMHQQGGSLSVWREVTSHGNWQPDPNQHPGIYWSWDSEAAEAHCGSFETGQEKWLLNATVKADQIDWVITLGQNASPDYDSEKEINLKPGKALNYTYSLRDKPGARLRTQAFVPVEAPAMSAPSGYEAEEEVSEAKFGM